MEPDVQGQAAELTQPGTQTQNASEGGKTPEQLASDGFKAEMMRERNARQELEAQLQNPDFVYGYAKSLGMTNDETPAPSEEVPAEKAKPQVKQQELTWEVIEARLAARASLEATAAADHALQVKDHPELQSDPVLNDLYMTYAKTMKFSDAAVKVLALQEKRQATKSPEQIASEQALTQSAKANATTGRTGTVTSSEADQEIALQKQMANRNNTSGQRSALLALLSSGKL